MCFYLTPTCITLIIFFILLMFFAETKSTVRSRQSESITKSPVKNIQMADGVITITTEKGVEVATEIKTTAITRVVMIKTNIAVVAAANTLHHETVIVTTATSHLEDKIISKIRFNCKFIFILMSKKQPTNQP